MLRISCDKTWQTRYARVPIWRPLEGFGFAEGWLSTRRSRV